MPANSQHLLLTRPGFTLPFAAECRSCGLDVKTIEHEYLRIEGERPSSPLALERQRLPNTELLPTHRLKPFDGDGCCKMLTAIMPELQPWALHLYAAEEADQSLERRLPALERFLRKGLKQVHAASGKFERKPEKLFRQEKGLILQGFLTDAGLWLSCAPPAQLSATRLGGRYRMKIDPQAPSRSYLKMEEALARIEVEPEDWEEVIDLGAAPGGWTWSFVRRGCQVTSVDNGPMKLPEEAAGCVTHIKADGMRFRLPESQMHVDWLVGDMLIPPGKAFSLLRYWVGENRCRRLIMNIKLPQEEPVPALKPILDWLGEQRNWDLQVRQLYHDRREVTVFGRVKE